MRQRFSNLFDFCMSPKKAVQRLAATMKLKVNHYTCYVRSLYRDTKTFLDYLGKLVRWIFSKSFVYFCLKTILDRLFPEKKEQHEREKEQYEREKEFLEARFYRDDVVFDPETAHPRLEVSENGKCVKDTGNVSYLPKSPNRFDSHICILAKDGFSKGKHYWEVEVGQKKNWVLGVASESICRQGRTTMSPQHGYWVIAFDDGKHYWARTDPWIHLKVSGKPTMLGIFLNMSDNSLCFYDVHRKSKLHTFIISDRFGGKLYPFFSNGSMMSETDCQPLKIPLLPY